MYSSEILSITYSNPSSANGTISTSSSGGLVEGKTPSVMSPPAASLGGLPLVLLLHAEVRLTPRSLPQAMQLFVNNVGIIVNADESTGWLSVILQHQHTPLKVCITSKQASYLTPLVPTQGDFVRIIKGKYVGKIGRLFSITDAKVEVIVEFSTGEMTIALIDQIIKLNSSYASSSYAVPSSRPATLSISGDNHMITQSSPVVVAPCTSDTSNTYISNDYSQAGGHVTSHTSPTDPHVIIPSDHMITTHEHSNDLCTSEPPRLISSGESHMTSQSYLNEHHMTDTPAQQDYIAATSHMTTQGGTSDGHMTQECVGDVGHVTTPVPSPMSSYQHSPLPYAMSPTSPWTNSHQQNPTTPTPYVPQVLSPVSPAPMCETTPRDQYDATSTDPSTDAGWTVGYANHVPSNGVYGPNKTFLQPPQFIYTCSGGGAVPTSPAQWPSTTYGGVTATYGADGKAYYTPPPSYVDHRMMTQYMLAAQVRNASYPTKPQYRQYATPTSYAHIQSLHGPRLTFAPSPFMSLPTHLPSSTPTHQQPCSQTTNKTESKPSICDELKSLLCNNNKSDDACNKGMAFLKKNGCAFVIEKIIEKLDTLEPPPTWYDPLSKNGKNNVVCE